MTSGVPVSGRRAGIVDVAERAGVSRQTVTRAMNDMPGISAGTKRRVLDAARELRYRPSRVGRALVSGSTAPTLGLVVMDLTNGFWAQLASAVLDEASEHGWTVLIAEATHGTRAAVMTLLDHVDALFGLVDLPEAQLDDLVGATPAVLLDPTPALEHRPGIRLDFDDAMNEAVAHLVARGRRRIVMLDWSRSGDGSVRAASFARAIRRQGLDALVSPHITVSEPAIDSGMRAAMDAFVRWPDLDAFVCFNDPIAVGAIKACQSSGKAVPADISVVGVDGSPVGLVVTPELTSLSFDFRELARIAFSAVAGTADDSVSRSDPGGPWSVHPRLTVRGSS